MEIYLDTAHLVDIERLIDLVDGVTTNPTLLARESSDMQGHLQKVLSLVAHGPVMAEVIAEDAVGMIREAQQLARLGEGIIVKVPAKSWKHGMRSTGPNCNGRTSIGTFEHSRKWKWKCMAKSSICAPTCGEYATR